MATEPTGAPLRWSHALGLMLVATTAGCFGDWVSARNHPKRDTATATANERAESPAPTPKEPCVAYLAEVARRCDAMFDGHLDRVPCHGELVRIQALFHSGDAPLDHRPRVADRPTACTQQRQALPPFEAEGAGAAMGPACRRWAELLRPRCVAPLSTTPPKLGGCLTDLLAFESMLGGITYGQPESYEAQCQDQVDRLTTGSTG